MRTQKIEKTMDTGKEVTSIEIIEQGQHITTADGNEVTFCCQCQICTKSRCHCCTPCISIVMPRLPTECWWKTSQSQKTF